MKKKKQKKVDSAMQCLNCLVPMIDTNYQVEDLRDEHQFMLVMLETKTYKVVQCPKCREKVPIIHSRYNGDCPY